MKHNWYTKPNGQPKAHFRRSCPECLSLAPHGRCALPFRMATKIRKWEAMDNKWYPRRKLK